MIHFGDLKVKTKLAVTFSVVLIPLLLTIGLVIYIFYSSLKESSDLELTNIVNHLYRLCEVHDQQISESGGNADSPRKLSRKEISDLSKVIATFKVGLTGYPYVMDSKGTLIIHPEKAGENIIDSRDSKGFAFIREICNQAVHLDSHDVGTIRYPWRNTPSESVAPRMKVLKFKYFKEWDWIIAAGSYEMEIYSGLGRIKWLVILFMTITVGLVALLTYMLGHYITSPLSQITKATSMMANGEDPPPIVLTRRKDELAKLVGAFNHMADQINEKTEDLERMVEKRTEELWESRETYRSLVESTIDGIIMADNKGTIKFINAGMEKMIGVPRMAVIGQKIWDLYPTGIEQAKEIMRRLKERGNITNYEMELLTTSGNVIPIRTSASLLRDRFGKEQGSLGIFSDMTSEKHLQSELKKAQTQLFQIMKIRALGDLVSGVAHEINNPLMAASTMLYVMNNEKCLQDCPNKSRLDVIKRCHDRIASIVNHLREFSRQTDFTMQEMNVNESIENALLITTQQLLNLQINIEKDLEPDLPLIQGDFNRLEQVFLDLIANSRDAMSEREQENRTLFVRTRKTELDGQAAIAIEIGDNGPGIPEEILTKIFDPFFTTKEVGKGTGLGLPICFGIIEEHGGRIEGANRPDGGAVFTVTLPLTHESTKTSKGA